MAQANALTGHVPTRPIINRLICACLGNLCHKYNSKHAECAVRYRYNISALQ